ncbi:MAG: hypothetical protein M1827_001739 [Pycnora praestabilis]|nr:MAG: hypothetical protein M1827_001739 [Pycnora praestabilis]
MASASSILQNTIGAKIRSADPQAPKKNAADRNIAHVVLGDLCFPTWYHSFYPEELVGRQTDRLYVCRWCFKYSKELMPYLAHVKVCSMRDELPPGKLIYKKNCYSIFEVDGEEHKLLTQNLSLFAKLFLDNKSVFYDVTSFLYYLLVYASPAQPHPSSSPPHFPQSPAAHRQVIGFFSKEKMSWDNNNLACILVFPPWQRKGMGKILMGVSYELSKREGRIGGPEKPLSALGRVSYLSFWSTTIARAILALPTAALPNKQFSTSTPIAITVSSLSIATYILPEDILAALQSMEILDPEKRFDDAAVISKVRIREWARKNNVDPASPPADPANFASALLPWYQRAS